MNGDSKHVFAYVSLGLAVISLAFWIGVESAEIAQLRTQVDLVSPVSNAQRLAVLEERQREMEIHIDVLDARINRRSKEQ